VDPARDGLGLRAHVAAVDRALHEPGTFPQAALAQALSLMEAATPLPALFMRSVIQALKGAPKLQPFVLDLLPRLIGRQVWADATQWQGWLLLARNLAPASYPALLALPPAVLDGALERLPPAVWSGLAKYVAGPACGVQVFAATRDVVDRYLDRRARARPLLLLRPPLSLRPLSLLPLRRQPRPRRPKRPLPTCHGLLRLLHWSCAAWGGQRGADALCTTPPRPASTPP